MSYYGGTVTVAGRDLITSLVAGETIQFTRIMVGSGALPEGVEPIDMTELVTPVAEGTSTTPVQDGGTVYMTIEYRSDLNGGLKEGFWLREFGVYAKTAETDEILLYYATLGNSPQPVNPLKDPALLRELAKDDSGIQFSHTLDEQIRGQIQAGFSLLDLYEDTDGQGFLHEHGVPTFWATLAVKR